MAGKKRERFGKYELVSRLGAGGMAETWRADLIAGEGVRKSVVIKRILPWRAAEAGFLEAFIQEARLSANLSHGNIAQVFDFGDVDGEYFIAMEFIDGLSLHDLLERAAAAGFWHLPYPVAMLIAIDACKGLHHAHTRLGTNGRPLGIVHRDVSPDNLIISFEGETKVVDFGVAKAAVAGRSETAPGLVKGKYHYFSPEQAVADPLDGRSDIYALGIVLYQMLCGAMPHAGNQVQVMTAIASGSYVPPLTANPDLIPALDKILARALAFDREQRFATALELQEALSNVLFSHAPRASGAWVKDFLIWLDAGDNQERSPLKPAMLQLIGQWKPSPRARAAAPGPALGSTSDISDRPTQMMRSPEPSRPPLPGWAWPAMVAVFFFAAGATTWLTLEAPQPQAPPPPPIVVTPEPVAPAAPPPRPAARPIDPTDQTVVPDEVRYGSRGPPGKFVLDEHHRVSVDAAANLGAKPQALEVTKWPATTYPYPNRLFDPNSNGPARDEDRQQAFVLANLADGSLRLRFLGEHDQWPGAHHVLFSLAPRMSWGTLSSNGAVRLTDGRFALGGMMLWVDSSDRFTIDSLAAAGPGWKIIVKQLVEKAPLVPALLTALPPRAGHGVVYFDGAPLIRDATLLSPGTHTLAGADFCWLTQPTYTGLEPSPLEIEFIADAAAAELLPKIDSMEFSCRAIASLPRAERTASANFRIVLSNHEAIVFHGRDATSPGSQLAMLQMRLASCRKTGGKVAIAQRTAVARTPADERLGLNVFEVDVNDVTVE